jgi:uncharacterized protein (TIGR03089 family)
VVKTHHLLTGELGLGVGDTALVAVPAHWISVPILLGCLTAGLELTVDGPADVAFVAPDTLASAGGAADVFAIDPGSAALGFRNAPPAPAADYVGAVRPQPDTWPSVHLAAGPGDPAFAGLSRGEVAARAADALPAGTRLLTTRTWRTPDDWLATVLAPVAARGSVVVVANCTDDAVLDRRAGQERATARD